MISSKLPVSVSSVKPSSLTILNAFIVKYLQQCVVENAVAEITCLLLENNVPKECKGTYISSNMNNTQPYQICRHVKLF